MTTPREEHTATLLGDGTVLIAGGFDGAGIGLNSAEFYDPVSKTFSAAFASMVMPRTSHCATVLTDGTVLLAGGGLDSDSSAEIYDPVTKAFSLIPVNMSEQRNGFASVLLPDGRVLLVGGFDNFATAVSVTAEIYDPVTQTFTPTTNTMTSPRYSHAATLLNDGTVLITGGYSDFIGTAVLVAERFDPATNAFTVVGPMVDARGSHTATLLTDGRVLVAGGVEVLPDGMGGEMAVFHQGSESFDGLSFVPGNSLVTARAAHLAVPLNNGTVLMVGGVGLLQLGLSSTEVYDPAIGTFTATASLSHGRYFHTATRLTDGDVLVTGGIDPASTRLASAELYH